jgi:hypothetical protein
MTADKTVSTFFAKLPEGFPMDKAATADAWKNWASFNERFAGIAIDTVSRTNEITTNTTQESLSRLRDLTKFREEPGEYSQAYVDFVQGQAALTRDTAEALSKVLEDAREQTAELLSRAGEKAEETGEENVKAATRKTTGKAKETAEKAEKTVEENA